ncbi:Uncharacterised protein [Bordetella pertussis]|nr:Uncharacterised protein [Bordetella pertussis]
MSCVMPPALEMKPTSASWAWNTMRVPGGCAGSGP